MDKSKMPLFLAHPVELFELLCLEQMFEIQ